VVGSVKGGDGAREVYCCQRVQWVGRSVEPSWSDDMGIWLSGTSAAA